MLMSMIEKLSLSRGHHPLSVSSNPTPRRVTRLAFTSLALCLFGFAFAGTASAGVCQNTPNPSATGALSSSTAYAYSNSVNANYATVGCKRWVVDVSVPSTTPPITFTDIVNLGAWPVSMPQSQATCEAFTLEVWFYKKMGNAFTTIGGGSSKGVWHPEKPGIAAARCEIKPNSSNPLGYLIARTAPAAGTDVYRIEVGAKVGLNWVPVYAKANYVQNPG